MKTTVAVLMAALLGGCAHLTTGAGGSQTPSPGGIAAPDLIGAWELVEGSGPDGAIDVPQGWRVTINFLADEVNGQACNYYGGTYAIGDDGRIAFDAMAMTEMACEEPMMMVEAAYHAALAEVSVATRDEERLTLSGPDAELVFRLLPPVPDEEIVGTRWILDSLIQGDAASSVVGEAFLELSSDGRFEGSTGCRQIVGRYVINGDTIDFVEMAANGDCRPALQEQDGHVLQVLGDGFVPAVDGRTLTMADNGGLGLVYRSDR
jgi:heat shock protein HslJ